MNMYDIILKKRLGHELSQDEIKFFVDGFTSGAIPDYQMSALLMAICFNSMTDKETVELTYAMADSGDKLDLVNHGIYACDKHSTGGVGDKTSLIVAPIVASCGVKIAKMSGRGLGHTGGTIDRLESIRGYKTELDVSEFLSIVEDVGVSIIGQTGNMAPADKKIYALRDVTATVDSIPLIASSVMSKKIAAGAKTIVLDVKAGSGAFMQDTESARVLAQKMVSIGKGCQRNVAALVTDMDVPLGKCVGNSLEVIEAIAVLRGEEKGELSELCIELSSLMLSLSLGIDRDEARERALTAVSDGSAFNKFVEWIKAQGGNEGWAYNTDLFPKAKYHAEVLSLSDGWIKRMNTQEIGRASLTLGAGRRTKDDDIDFAAGLVVERKTGDRVEKGDLLATLYSNDFESLAVAKEIYLNSVEFSEESVERPRLIYDIVI